MDSVFGSISELFKAIISLVGAVFGFLPEWSLKFLASALAVAVALFIYRLIRG